MKEQEKQVQETEFQKFRRSVDKGLDELVIPFIRRVEQQRVVNPNSNLERTRL